MVEMDAILDAVNGRKYPTGNDAALRATILAALRKAGIDVAATHPIPDTGFFEIVVGSTIIVVASRLSGGRRAIVAYCERLLASKSVQALVMATT